MVFRCLGVPVLLLIGVRETLSYKSLRNFGCTILVSATGSRHPRLIQARTEAFIHSQSLTG